MFTKDDVRQALAVAGIDISTASFGLEDVRQGMEVELEHGTRYPDLNVTDDDPVVSAKIALAHLREYPDYYARLAVMEREAEAAWAVTADSETGII